MSQAPGAATRRADLPSDARAAMERLNAEAGKLNIWLRTQANAPAQRPWFRETGLEASGRIAAGRVGAAQLKAVAHHWRWQEISPYLDRIAEIARAADVSPIEFAERQQFLLTNPGLGGRLQVTSTMRCAVSIYNPGDVAPVHIHTPNASRTILSENGGYTTIEGERCKAARGDLILTPNGTWHDHGNDGAEPVVWIDVLDFPLMEFLDCVWLDEEFPGATEANAARTGPRHRDAAIRKGFTAAAALVPGFVLAPARFRRGSTRRCSTTAAPMSARQLDALRGETGDPYEGITLRFVNPATGESVFPTLDYSRATAAPGRGDPAQARDRKHALHGHRRQRFHGDRRRSASTGSATTFSSCRVFCWRRHVNTGDSDAVLYAVSDVPLIEKIGQYRAQGRDGDNTVIDLVP